MAAAVRSVYAYSLAFNPVKAKIGREECGMKLLGVAELADGSLNFAFGVPPEGSTSPGYMLDTAMAGQPQLASSQLPLRLPSAFQKKSPITKSTKRRELPTRSREPLTKEAELPKLGAVAEDVLSADLKKEKVHVVDRHERNRLHLSQEAGSGQTTSSRKTPGHILPSRMKSKFLKQSPVPSSSGAIHTSVNASSKSSVASDGAQRAPKKVPLHTTSEISLSTRGDIAVDVSVQTGTLTAETIREHVANETQDLAKLTSKGSDISSAANAHQLQEPAALNIQGLSVSISSLNSAEQGGAVDYGSKAASVEILTAYKLADLKSMAKSKGLKGYSKLKKGELIELLSKQDH